MLFFFLPVETQPAALRVFSSLSSSIRNWPGNRGSLFSSLRPAAVLFPLLHRRGLGHEEKAGAYRGATSFFSSSSTTRMALQRPLYAPCRDTAERRRWGRKGRAPRNAFFFFLARGRGPSRFFTSFFSKSDVKTKGRNSAGPSLLSPGSVLRPGSHSPMFRPLSFFSAPKKTSRKSYGRVQVVLPFPLSYSRRLRPEPTSLFHEKIERNEPQRDALPFFYLRHRPRYVSLPFPPSSAIGRSSRLA